MYHDSSSRTAPCRTQCPGVVRPFALVFAAALAFTPVSAYGKPWAVYQDSTSDCRIEYPNTLFTQEPLDVEEDIQRFSGPDEQTYFRVRAVDNEERLSPAEVKAKYLQSDIPGDITYQRTRSDFLVLSGYRHGSIFYTKVTVSPDQQKICILEITYPRNVKRRFDAIVTRMSRSFGFES